jgi:hypothetical protein
LQALIRFASFPVCIFPEPDPRHKQQIRFPPDEKVANWFPLPYHTGTSNTCQIHIIYRYVSAANIQTIPCPISVRSEADRFRTQTIDTRPAKKYPCRTATCVKSRP